ncbi:hypothetical protein P7228_01835 [Altererythrobacter arenosus]|uniref:Secreted protein n=1 Tax=Altererythrobacter arenosus TaxID=3032592 RepID=A0ABY8FS60_9SPHN|nr:hypothetical protein [Altererythrobacter sp. CAU 1644]WFL77835.1 hypothetical protein P7228_01835 [Altererythrobacter sp. CAU 1644]
MRGPGRLLGILLIALIIAAVAVALNKYADDQAEEIASVALEQRAEQEDDADEVEPTTDEPSEDCVSAQAEYDEKWDRSVEEPDNVEAEEALEEELTELLAACET